MAPMAQLVGVESTPARADARADQRALLATRQAAYASAAERLAMSEEAVRKEVSRMRQRYRELFCEEIANTVSHPSEVEEEVRYLMRVLAS